MKTINALLLALSLLFIGLEQAIAQKIPEDEATQILRYWQGAWNNEATIHKSIWMPQEMKVKGSSQSGLILKSHFLEISGKNDLDQSKTIIRYDQASQGFNRWEFKSEGNTSFWTGKWDQSKKAMVWSFVDFSNSGISGQITEWFVSADKIKSKVIMKDRDGGILINIEGISIRQ